MIIGKKDILDYFKELDKKYFAVFKKGTVDTGNPILKSEEDKESTPEDAYRNFERLIQWLRTGEYTLILNNDQKVTSRGSNRIDFRITMEDSLTAQGREAIGSPGIGGTFDVETMVSRAKLMATEEFAKLMAERDLQDLKLKYEEAQKELKEAQQKVEDPWNKFIGAMAPHADSIVSGLIGKPAAPMLSSAVSGVHPDLHLDENGTTEELRDHAQKVFEDFAEALQTAKPSEFLEILVKLTTLVKNNPQKFETALNFL